MVANREDRLANPAAEVDLVLACTGRSRFARTGWTAHRLEHWVLDLITHGRQMQRVGAGPAFERRPGLLALYAPLTPYHELQTEGQTLAEAYMVFAAAGRVERQLRQLAGPDGYCHIEDPHELVIAPLQRLGTYYLARGPGMDLLVWGLMLQCLGSLSASTSLGPHRRRLAPAADPRASLLTEVARYLESRLEQPIRVKEMADALGMSDSALAHAYPKAAGETPYQAILRSKMVAAKRLMLTKGLSVKETADRLGFSSAFNFSRAFKRLEGCAPRQYVARHTRRTLKTATKTSQL
ncbi:MAG: helix-turn-helix transcriptional regulator [Phycisphaeraceae bacterium]|nr:helix-turn-helix transcriptional regulator [Phycisphaeraceae bacterium]